MPQALTHPGVYIEEVSSGVRTITGVATSIALFVGWAPKGPIDRAVRITSFADFARSYGGLDVRSLLGYAVKQFYDNGGSDAYVVRLVNKTLVPAVTGPPAIPAIPGAATAKVKIKFGTDHLLIKASSPGKWANSYQVKATGSATQFKLEILDPDGNVVESFFNLSMTETDPRFAGLVINGRSAYLDDLETTASGGVAATSPVSLAGGEDGQVLNPTNDGDTVFQTQLDGLFQTGGIADRLDLFNIICVPGLKASTPIQALQKYAKANRAFLLVDGSEFDTVAAPGTPPRGPEADHSGYYFPWLQAPDPLQSNAIRAFPPSGFVAGIYARTDSQRGVWKAPAGTDSAISGTLGPSINMSDEENGQLNPLGINCLRTLPIYGNVVWGARTLFGEDDRGSEWKYVPVRRMALFLEESLYRGTQWVVFEPNDEPLWAQVRLNVGAFLHGLFRQGAFQGKTPREAYFVKCDRETTTQADINRGILNIHVGFAPLKPAEFVVIRIQQMAGEIQT